MVHIRPFGRHEIPVFRALLLRLTDFLSVFLPAIFPMFVPAWGATERILGCLAKGCLGKGSRVRYPLEPVWGLLGFFRAVWMTSGCDLRRLPSGGGFGASFLGIEQPWAAPSVVVPVQLQRDPALGRHTLSGKDHLRHLD